MPVPDGDAVGPLRDDVIRPVRGIVTVRALCVLVLVLGLMVLGVASAPEVLAGVGLAPRVQATVTEVRPIPGTVDAGTGRRGCDRNRITYSWGGHRSGVAEPCASAAGGSPAVGSGVALWVLPGWDRVVTGSRAPWSALAAVEIVAMALCGWALARYGRQLRALRALQERALAGPVLAGRRDRGTRYGRGQLALRIRVDGYGRRRIVIARAGLPAGDVLGWQEVDVHPLRRTARGRPAGPYVLVPRDAASAHPVVGVGRPLRRDRP